MSFSIDMFESIANKAKEGKISEGEALKILNGFISIYTESEELRKKKDEEEKQKREEERKQQIEIEQINKELNKPKTILVNTEMVKGYKVNHYSPCLTEEKRKNVKNKILLSLYNIFSIKQ
jgi:hypothetical protein